MLVVAEDDEGTTYKGGEGFQWLRAKNKKRQSNLKYIYKLPFCLYFISWWSSVCYKYTCRVLCLCTWGWDEIQSVNHTQILDQCYLRKGKSRDDKEEASRAVELFCPPSVYPPVPTVPLWSSLHQRFKWSNRTKEDWTSWVLQSIIVAIHNWVAFKVQIPHWTGLSWLVFSNCLLAGNSSRAD